MFDIGWSELVVIGVVALIAIGPKELPGVLRSVGFWMGKVRRMASEFQGQFQEAMREAEMSDLKKHADDLNNAAKQLTSSFETFRPAEGHRQARSRPARPRRQRRNPQPAMSKPKAAHACAGLRAGRGNAGHTAVADTESRRSPRHATPAEPSPPEPVRREA